VLHIKDSDELLKSTTFACVLLVAFAGCRGTGDSKTETETETAPAVHGRIAGVVTTPDGAPISDVGVTAQGAQATTGPTGVYVIEDVYPGENVGITFSKRGYATTHSNVALHSWETATSNVAMLPIDGLGTFESQAGGAVIVGDVRAFFPSEGIADSDGYEYTGQVTVEITHVDPSTEEIVGAPGDLKARGDVDGEETTLQLVSYGMVDITLYGEDDQLLNMASGKKAQIQLPIGNGDLPDGLILLPGMESPTWSFDPVQGLWVEEGSGTVTVTEQGVTVLEFPAQHFSWWNCDQGFVPTCAAGRVIDMLDFPIRGAQVRCDGDQSTSTATADEDGYYTCPVLAGDSILVEGTTHVGGQNWMGSVGAYAIDGSTASSSDCQPMPDVRVEVCRISGAVTVENVDAIIKETDQGTESASADHFSAVFWEPMGDPVYCSDPWQSLELDSCWKGTEDELVGQFPESAVPGIPESARSVGTWFEMSTPRHAYKADREEVNGLPYYNWNSHEAVGDMMVTSRPEIEEGDLLSLSTSGDWSSYFGAWTDSSVISVPNQLTLSDRELITYTGGSLDLRYLGAEGDEPIYVNATFPDGYMMMCRFSDVGQVMIPHEVLADAPNGWGGIGVYRLETEITSGPDGLPIWTQAFSGETTPISIE